MIDGDIGDASWNYANFLGDHETAHTENKESKTPTLVFSDSTRLTRSDLEKQLGKGIKIIDFEVREA